MSRFSIFFLAGCLLFSINSAHASPVCNPVVKPSENEKTLIQILTRLANEYKFSLSFPKSLDAPANLDESMALDKSIKLLTSSLNTVLRHEKTEGCDKPRLVELTVIPTGEETEYVTIKQKSFSQPDEYTYITDMEQYVTDVLLNKRKAKLQLMTPEQRSEFKIIKKHLKRKLRKEIQQAKKKTKNNQGKNKTEMNSVENLPTQ